MIQYKKLIDIMNKINSSISFQHLITTIIDSANELLAAEGASLLLLDPETEELIFDIVLSDKGEVIRGKRLRLGQGIAGHSPVFATWPAMPCPSLRQGIA
ncbi:MAG TPA: hypothetical protein PLL11_17560, partial [Spirochaetota bacterium]|nr:hypothetical protein [Spirochaetota bacterium]